MWWLYSRCRLSNGFQIQGLAQCQAPRFVQWNSLGDLVVVSYRLKVLKFTFSFLYHCEHVNLEPWALCGVWKGCLHNLFMVGSLSQCSHNVILLFFFSSMLPFVWKKRKKKKEGPPFGYWTSCNGIKHGSVMFLLFSFKVLTFPVSPLWQLQVWTYWSARVEVVFS